MSVTTTSKPQSNTESAELRDSHKRQQKPRQPQVLRQPQTPTTWGGFVRAYLRPFWRQFTWLAILLAASIGLQLLGPQIIRVFIDTATAHGVQMALVWLALFALAAALLNQGAQALTTYVGQDVGWAATNLIREDLALHCLKLDMSYHNQHTPGEFIERIDGDLTALSNFFALMLIQVVGSGGLLIGTMVVLLLIDWRIGLALTIFVAVSLFILIRMRNHAVGAGVTERESSALFLGFMEERLAGVEDIRANGGNAYVMDRFYVAMRRWFTQSVNAWVRRSRVWTVTTLLFALGVTMTLGMSAYLFLVLHAVTLGTVYLFVQYTLLLEGPIENITQQMQEFQKAASSLIRVRTLYLIQPQIADEVSPAASATRLSLPTGVGREASGVARVGSLPDGALAAGSRPASTASFPTSKVHAPTTPSALPSPTWEHGNTGRGPLAVAFDHVTFAYHENDGPVLHDVSFALEPGKVMGLLGRTGSGKTTISRLLFRLYDTTEGAIRLNGVDLRDLPLSLLRQRIGLVTQDVQLFQATVRDNLTFFDPTIADDRIMAVIETMELESWFARLPDGLDTHLEASGAGLSAGEAQLLAFIRVFLRDPGLVILDEPSSRLDLATERLIERGVSALLRNRTGLIIAHRLGTVQRADLIMTLGDGRILEYGPREELTHNPDSRFATLLRMGLEEALA